MLDGYHRWFNGFALQEVIRPADVPDPALGVGFAESLRSTPLRISYEPVQQQAVIRKIVTQEDASMKGTGKQISITEFPATGWMGDYLGGY